MTHLILGLGNPGDEYQATRHNAGFRVLDELARRLGVRLNRLDCSSLVARAELAAPPVLTLHASAAPPAPADAGGAAGDAGAAPSGSGAASRVADAMPAAVGADGWEPSDTGSAAPAVVPVLLAKPQTYMNRSGFAARCLVESHGLDVARVLVVYDELNLPLGRLRLRRDGNPAGHRGMESIIESLRTAQVARLRVGIAPESGPPAGGDPLVDFVLSPFTAAEEEAFVEVVARAADACQTWLGEGIVAAMNRFNGG